MKTAPRLLSRRQRLLSRPSRRRLLFESLESRALLAGFNFPNFDDPSPLTLIGDAAITADDRLRLTPAAGGQEGAAWYTLEKQFVGYEFSTTFQFQMADNFDSPGGSDGFVFAIQNAVPNYLAGGGGTLGYHNLPSSLVVEFDTFQNSEAGDPSESHISIHTNGTGPNSWLESLSLGSYNTNPILDDANVHTAKITYTPGSLSIYLDNLTTPKLTVAVDLADKLALTDGRAWIGFTGTTGGGWQTHDILNWSFDSMIPATTLSIDNASVVEGNAGAADIVFTVTRSGDLSAPSTVNWATADGTATASSGDYVASSGQIAFAADETTQTITLPVSGDTAIEAHETLSVILSGATGAAVLDGQGQGTILTDDVSVSISDATATEGANTARFIDVPIGVPSSPIDNPKQIVKGTDGDYFVTSATTNSVARYDAETFQYLGDFVSPGQGGLFNPIGLVFASGDLFVASAGTDAVLRYDGQTGAFVEQFIPSGAFGIDRPTDLVVRNGELYVSAWSGGVHRYDLSTGAFLGLFVDGMDDPAGIAFGPDGNFYVVEFASGANNAILRFDGNTGAFIEEFVPDGGGGMSRAATITFGPDGSLYVVDSSAVYRFHGLTGAFMDIFIPQELGGIVNPTRLTFEGNQAFLVSSGTDQVMRFGAASVTAFTVSLSSPSSLPVTVNYSTTSGSALTGSDFTHASGTITFAPGQTSQTILVQTLDDTEYEGNETIFVNLSSPVGGVIADGQGVGTIIDNELPPTKFYVVNEGSPDSTYEYGSTGSAVENYALNSGNSAPRGAASTAAGDKVWVVDSNKKVYVYDTSGGLLGSWTAGSLASNATVQGIATNGTDIWIVDARQDRVYRYTGAASRFSGSQNAASNFALNSGNKDATDLVTDGSSIWVLNNSSTDKVFKYTVSGSLVGSWAISSGGGSPTGITLDPASPSHLWIVDSGADRVYQYDNAVGRTSGSQAASTSFALTAGNTNPQGIADPPTAGDSPDAAPPPSQRGEGPSSYESAGEFAANLGRSPRVSQRASQLDAAHDTRPTRVPPVAPAGLELWPARHDQQLDHSAARATRKTMLAARQTDSLATYTQAADTLFASDQPWLDE